MYVPYDPRAHQGYNDPKPDHYASGSTSHGMPQLPRPAAVHLPAEQSHAPPHQGYGAPPIYPPANPSSHADQYSHHRQSTQYPPAAPTYTPNYPPKHEKSVKEERHGYQSVPKRDEKKDNGASEEAKLMIKQLKETNEDLKLQLSSSRESTDRTVREKEAVIEKLRRDGDISRSKAAVGQKEAVAAIEREWLQKLSSKERANQQLLASIRREAEANERRLSAKEQETQQLLAQARRDAEISAQRGSSKEQEYQQLLAQARRDAEISVQKGSSKEQEYQQLLAQARRDAEASAQKLSSREQETEQLLIQLRRDVEASEERLSLKAQQSRDLVDQTEKDAASIAQLKREWAARLAQAEQENSLLLVRFSKLQSDTETERSSLLDTNASQEEKIEKLREEAKQHRAEIVKLKDMTTNQETELMNLRDESSKLLGEVTQLDDAKRIALQSVKKIEGEKREVEERVRQLKGDSAEFTADINDMNLEKKKLFKDIAALKKELDESHDLCEERRLRIEELDNEQLPTLNNQIEFMSMLDEKAKGKVVELEERLAKLADMLEVSRRARDTLEHQLEEAEKRETESNRQMARENRVATDELERVRFELDRLQGDHAKYFATVKSEKTALEYRVAQVEGTKKEALDRISALEKSLKKVTETRDNLQEEMGIRENALEREIQEGDEAKAEHKLTVRKLEEQIYIFTSAKSTLEVEVAASEAKQIETEATIKALNENYEIETQTLRSNIEKLEEQVHILTSAKDTLEAAVAASEAKQFESEAMIKALNENYETESQTLRSNIEKLEEQVLTVTQENVAGSEAKTIETEGILKVLNEEIEKYKTDTQTLRSSVETLEAQIAESESRRAETEHLMQAMLKASNEEMEDYKMDSETLRSNMEELEVKVSALSTAKSALEAQVADSEAKKTEAENMLHFAEEMLIAVQEDAEKHKVDTEINAKGGLKLNEEKTLLEGKMADFEKRNAELSEQMLQLGDQVKALEDDKAELLTELDRMDKTVAQHEESLARNDAELQNKKKMESEVKELRLELSQAKEGLEALEDEIGNLKNKLRDANGRVMDLEEERSDLETRNVAYLDDKKAVAVKASKLGMELCEKETEYEKLNDRFNEINGNYLDIVAERDELTETIKNLRK